MLERIRRYWSSLKRGRPGSRFQQQYERQQKSGSGSTGRILRLVAGMVILPVGLFLLPAPGPGVIVVALGALLIARESRVAAVALDWIEVRGREWARAGRRSWRRIRRVRAASR